MIKSASQYSYLVKRLQLAAILIAALFALYKTTKLHAHLDIHMHRTHEVQKLEEEVEKKGDEEAYQRVHEGDGDKGDELRAQRYMEKHIS